VSGHANGVAIIVPDGVQSIFGSFGLEKKKISSQFLAESRQSPTMGAAILPKTVLKAPTMAHATIWGQSIEKPRDSSPIQQYTVI
jgi:hypothetical protein